MLPAWEEVDHTADWALRVRGADLRSLFEHAAQGMVSLIGGQADPAQPVLERDYNLRAPDLETLLVDWLSALLYAIEDDGIVFAQIAVKKVADLTLEARAAGRPGGGFEKHIKAVTFHNLEVRRTLSGYETVIVFDV